MTPDQQKKIAIGLTLEEKKGIRVPRVTASATGILAEKIKSIAKENNIPLIENSDLAEDLFLLEVGSYLPEKLFPVVAEIIAHIHYVSAMKRSKNE